MGGPAESSPPAGELAPGAPSPSLMAATFGQTRQERRPAVLHACWTRRQETGGKDTLGLGRRRKVAPGQLEGLGAAGPLKLTQLPTGRWLRTAPDGRGANCMAQSPRGMRSPHEVGREGCAGPRAAQLFREAVPAGQALAPLLRPAQSLPLLPSVQSYSQENPLRGWYCGTAT